MHEMYGCQPAICAPAMANMAKRVKMHLLPGPRMDPPGARAQGAVAGDIYIGDCSRARARQQIKISQNSGTQVPKRGKNGYPDCTCTIPLLEQT